MTAQQIDKPVACRWCHVAETSYLLASNHGGEYGIHWGCCMAQMLTRNHVLFALKYRNWDQLERDLQRAAELWSAHPDGMTWAAEAYAALERHLLASAPPDHAALVGSEQGALL